MIYVSYSMNAYCLLNITFNYLVDFTYSYYIKLDLTFKTYI